MGTSNTLEHLSWCARVFRSEHGCFDNTVLQMTLGTPMFYASFLVECRRTELHRNLCTSGWLYTPEANSTVFGLACSACPKSVTNSRIWASMGQNLRRAQEVARCRCTGVFVSPNGCDFQARPHGLTPKIKNIY